MNQVVFIGVNNNTINYFRMDSLEWQQAEMHLYTC